MSKTPLKLELEEKCRDHPDPSLCRDQVLADAIDMRTISKTVSDLLQSHINLLASTKPVIEGFAENIPAMNQFNQNFTEFMGQKEVKLNSIDSAVKNLTSDMSDAKVDIEHIKTDIKDIKKKV